jgi:signal transduction histidine kinase
MPHSYEETLHHEADLVEGQRYAAIQQLVNGLQRQLRNALQRAQACFELVELGISDADERRQMMANVGRALTDLYQTYDQVQAYASPISLTFTLVDLEQFCQTVFDELTGALKDCDASLKFADCGCCIEASLDPIQMRIVLRHLLDNAIASSGPKAAVEIGCCDGMLSDRAAIELVIRDHGTGFDSAVAGQLFEPFVTTKQRGLGLGLAACRRIVAAHGGEIHARNHPEGGAEVRIILPK